MKLIVRLSICALLAGTMNAYAGLTQTTVHSRANCLNNESITWWYDHPFNWRVVSVHEFPGWQVHNIDTGFIYNSRVAAIHWGEGDVLNNWVVYGYHYLYEYHKTLPFDQTYAEHCNIIDGWF